MRIERQEESVVSRVRVEAGKKGREKRKKERKKEVEGIFGYPIVGLGYLARG